MSLTRGSPVNQPEPEDPVAPCTDDPDAWAAFRARLRVRVFDVARRRLASEADAEEIVERLYRAYRRAFLQAAPAPLARRLSVEDRAHREIVALIYERHQPVLLKGVSRAMRYLEPWERQQLGEDLVQDTLLRFLERDWCIQVADKLGGYAFRAALNVGATHLRKHTTRPRSVPLDDLIGTPHEPSNQERLVSPEDVALAAEARDHLHARIARLAEVDRYILGRSYGQDATDKQIAAELGRSVAAVKQRRQRAVRALAARFTASYLGGRSGGRPSRSRRSPTA